MHPYHYSAEKNIIQRLLDWIVPLGLLFLYLQFYNFNGDKISSFAYNFGQITPSEMIKTSGLLAISLLSFSLVIGPLCRFFPSLDVLKAHKYIKSKILRNLGWNSSSLSFSCCNSNFNVKITALHESKSLEVYPNY